MIRTVNSFPAGFHALSCRFASQFCLRLLISVVWPLGVHKQANIPSLIAAFDNLLIIETRTLIASSVVMLTVTETIDRVAGGITFPLPLRSSVCHVHR